MICILGKVTEDSLLLPAIVGSVQLSHFPPLASLSAPDKRFLFSALSRETLLSVIICGRTLSSPIPFFDYPKRSEKVSNAPLRAAARDVFTRSKGTALETQTCAKTGARK